MEQQREKIDVIDDQILVLLNQRAQLALHLAQEKRRRRLPVVDSDREIQVIHRLTAKNQGPLSASAIAHVYKSIIAEMRSLEETHIQTTAS